MWLMEVSISLKTKFVAKGFCLKEGVNYDETFAPIARYISINTMVSIASSFAWPLYQIDVKIVF
jgi:hypothetical protein